MKLTNKDLENKKIWLDKGYELPEYDRELIKKNTLENPTWVHFGAGNIFRGFPAAAQQTLLNKGIYDKGIVVCESFDHEIIERAYKPYDDLSLLVVLKANKEIEKRIIGSVNESLIISKDNIKDWERIISIFENQSLQMVSFTITEKGYSLVDSAGKYLSIVEDDFKNGLDNPIHLIGRITALCYKRYQKGAYPLSLVSMDNCSHNGDKLYEAVKDYAVKWVENNFVDKGFVDYISNKDKVSFPLSMIDKITPRPDDNVKQMLEQDGFEDTQIIITSKNTYTSPFVNAEEVEYLVIEDLFPNGRPPLDKAGIIFTDRETVDKVEKMKVCTCLNPLHTALAIFGCLLSYKTIFEEMQDEHLSKLVNIIGYEEGMPVVVNPEIVDPKKFLREVLEMRLPNPFMPDTPQRIATDTSQKLPIRFGETIKAYNKSDKLDVNNLVYIPFVIAGWCRYLLGVDDAGNTFELSSDPMLDELKGYLEGIKLGDNSPFTDKLKPILENEKIFAVNLYEIGLGERVEEYFAELVKGKGAVRTALKRLLD